MAESSLKIWSGWLSKKGRNRRPSRMGLGGGRTNWNERYFVLGVVPEDDHRRPNGPTPGSMCLWYFTDQEMQHPKGFIELTPTTKIVTDVHEMGLKAKHEGKYLIEILVDDEDEHMHLMAPSEESYTEWLDYLGTAVHDCKRVRTVSFTGTEAHVATDRRRDSVSGEPPIAEGYLWKRAVKSGINMKMRYFELYQDGRMCYYRDKTLKGVLQLDADFHCSDWKGKKYGFQISDLQTTFYLAAKKKSEKVYWLGTITGVLRAMIRKERAETIRERCLTEDPSNAPSVGEILAKITAEEEGEDGGSSGPSSPGAPNTPVEGGPPINDPSVEQLIGIAMKMRRKTVTENLELEEEQNEDGTFVDLEKLFTNAAKEAARKAAYIKEKQEIAAWRAEAMQREAERLQALAEAEAEALARAEEEMRQLEEAKQRAIAEAEARAAEEERRRQEEEERKQREEEERVRFEEEALARRLAEEEARDRAEEDRKAQLKHASEASEARAKAVGAIGRAQLDEPPQAEAEAERRMSGESVHRLSSAYFAETRFSAASEARRSSAGERRASVVEQRRAEMERLEAEQRAAAEKDLPRSRSSSLAHERKPSLTESVSSEGALSPAEKLARDIEERKATAARRKESEEHLRREKAEKDRLTKEKVAAKQKEMLEKSLVAGEAAVVHAPSWKLGTEPVVRSPAASVTTPDPISPPDAASPAPATPLSPASDAFHTPAESTPQPVDDPAADAEAADSPARAAPEEEEGKDPEATTPETPAETSPPPAAPPPSTLDIPRDAINSPAPAPAPAPAPLDTASPDSPTPAAVSTPDIPRGAINSPAPAAADAEPSTPDIPRDAINSPAPSFAAGRAGAPDIPPRDAINSPGAAAPPSGAGGGEEVRPRKKSILQKVTGAVTGGKREDGERRKSLLGNMASGLMGNKQSGIKAMWEKRAADADSDQKTNPFSSKFEGHLGGGKVDTSKGEYGKPLPGSETERRGLAAKAWVEVEINKLLGVIAQIGYKTPEGPPAATFGDLFEAYADISDSLVGILMRAKKRELLTYNGDMLFQRIHDHIVIAISARGQKRYEDSLL